MRVVASLAIVTAVVLAPAPSVASGHRHSPGAHSRPAVRSVPPRPFVGRPLAPRPFFPHAFRRPFVGFVCCASSVVVVSPSPAYAPPATNYPPTYAAPYSATYGATYLDVAPAPPPTPTVVEYPGGRYELRGDGVRVPYVWVWVPNPPPGPPPAPPSGYQPGPPPPAPQSAPAPSSGRSEIYHWTDERGVTTWTDQPDKVPERFRSQPRPSKITGL